MSYNLNSTIYDRVEGAICLPFQVARDAVLLAEEVTVKITFTALSVLTLGKVSSINNIADREIEPFIPCTYQRCMNTINPKFKGYIEGSGFFTQIVWRTFNKSIEGSLGKKDFFSKHVLPRIVYIGSAPALMVSRTMDLALGILAAIVTIPFLGKSESDNRYVMTHLAFTKVINDVCIGVRGFVNPQQFD